MAAGETEQPREREQAIFYKQDEMDLKSKTVDEMVTWLEEQKYSRRVIEAFERKAYLKHNFLYRRSSHVALNIYTFIVSWDALNVQRELSPTA